MYKEQNIIFHDDANTMTISSVESCYRFIPLLVKHQLGFGNSVMKTHSCCHVTVTVRFVLFLGRSGLRVGSQVRQPLRRDQCV